MKKVKLGMICIILLGVCFGIVSFRNLSIKDNNSADVLLQNQTVTSVYVVEHLTGREKTLRVGSDDGMISKCLDILEETEITNSDDPKYDISVLYSDGSSKFYTIASYDEEQTEFFGKILNEIVTQL